MLSYGVILDKIKNYKWQKSFIRYFAFIFVLLIIVFLAIGSFAYHGYEVNRKKRIQENARDTLFTMHKEFASLFASVDNYLNDAIVNENVNLFMLSGDIQNHINILAINEIIHNMVMYVKGQTYINSVYLYSPASGYVISSSTFTNNFFHYFADKQWMKQYEKNHDEIIIRTLSYNHKDYKYISIVKAIPNRNGRVGYVVFNIDAASLMAIDDSNELYLVDNQGDIVLSNKEEAIQKNISYDQKLNYEFGNIQNGIYGTSLYGNGVVISSVSINHSQYSLLIKENLSKYERNSMISGISLLLILLAIVSISLGIAFLWSCSSIKLL